MNMFSTELLLQDEEADTLEVTLTPEQYDWIKRRAERRDMSTAQFVRDMLARLQRVEAIRKQS